jgi:UDP-2-acetamido-3-amino-2,3-dideoxy-glucuronate N-acetyltransferase
MKSSENQKYYLHPSADVQSREIGEGSTIWQFSVILKGAKIGKECNINCHTFIENDVVLGDQVTIKSGVYLWDGLQIENKVMIGPNVTFTNDKHPRSKNKDFKIEKTILREGCSIGAAAVILGGIEIGRHALIAAGALVTKNVPARALFLGNPAKQVGWVSEDGSRMFQRGDEFEDQFGTLWQELNNELVKKL